MRVGFRQTLAYFRDRQVPWLQKLPALLAILYVISPVDLIPDAIPILGWLDDLGVVSAVAAWYLARIRAHGAPPEQGATALEKRG